MKNQKTLVLGASLKQERYSNIAIKRLLDNNIEVVALGAKRGEVSGVTIEVSPILLSDIDTITLYLSPKNQQQYYDYIKELQPRRVIFNPGTENMELIEILQKEKIHAEIACTLVLLSTKQF
ncbi:CoA-binding protein [Tenacibaculum sp. M341]|uniref:CoA-binding protein n=1 Tax=Tenacibaculum sp. M341 TaxID=2530339 RepID=UPI00105215CE|nr:CoA-binding protein [Tenacibaculum sp. M341]TCI85267.1 CoA-binding protein [Tenacibaculum sp. M341]